MAYKYKYLDGNVSYSGISDIGVVMGSKIGFAEYITSSDHSQITLCRPVVNAIDIDWNGATIDGMSWEINTTGDLLRALKSLHTTLENLKIPHSILELDGGSRVLTIDNFESIKEELRGLSAYEIAKKLAQQNNQSFPYTEESWVASLKGATGAPGANGANGRSAYELALAKNPNIGSEDQWLESLKGKSAYETAMQAYNVLGYPFPYQNEVEWMGAIAKIDNIIINGDNIHISVAEVPNEDGHEFKIIGTDIASAQDLRDLQQRVNNIFNDDDNSISDIVKKELEDAFIPNDASEGSLNSISKIANWIQNHPSEYNTLYEKVINLQSSWDENLDKFAYKGNLYDINGQLKEIRSGVKFGETVEDINNLIKDMSFAKNVEDGAEQNWVTGINIKDQNVNIKGVPVKIKGADGEETENLQILSADYDGVLRTISFGANTDVIETIADKAVDLSVDMSKTYIDNKLSWKIN